MVRKIVSSDINLKTMIMNVKDFTYTELNKMFCELIDVHSDDTNFFSVESAKEFGNDELISGDYLCVQNAFDDLATKIDGLKDVFNWSCGIDGNAYNVGLMHNKANEFHNVTYRMDMIMAECLRMGVDLENGRKFVRIMNEMECVKI